MKRIDSPQKKQKAAGKKKKKSKKVTYDEKAYLNVPFDEKDEAKELGAWWDPKRKQWYVRPNKDVTPFAHWNPKPDDGKCLGCGEFIEEHDSHEGEEYKCGFCDRDICGKCLPFSEEGSWRCDGCGAYSCNALGNGSKKCPKFWEKDGDGPDMPHCGNFGRGRGCCSGRY